MWLSGRDFALGSIPLHHKSKSYTHTRTIANLMLRKRGMTSQQEYNLKRARFIEGELVTGMPGDEPGEVDCL